MLLQRSAPVSSLTNLERMSALLPVIEDKITYSSDAFREACQSSTVSKAYVISFKIFCQHNISTQICIVAYLSLRHS